MKKGVELQQPDGYLSSFVLAVDRFFDYLNNRDSIDEKSLPSSVLFSSDGTMVLDMTFYNGYAYDTNAGKFPFFDRIALYYPTISEVENDISMQKNIEDKIGRSWLLGDERQKILDIANVFGKASSITCPENRYEAACKAFEERVKDPSAKSLTSEQLATLKLAVACEADIKSEKDNFHENLFYDSIYYDVSKRLNNVPEAWKTDAYSELLDLAEGIVRGESKGLKY